MLRILGNLGILGAIVTCPVWAGWLVGLAIIGAPIVWLDKHSGAHLVTEDQTAMTITPVSVQWGQGSDDMEPVRTMTLTVTNNTDETWKRFSVWCDTNRGVLSSAEATDMSGLGAHQTDTRTYTISGGTGGETSTITSVKNCEIDSHMRGKPTAFDAQGDFERAGGGGWGDRLPGTTASVADQPRAIPTPSAAAMEDGSDPTIDTN